MTSELDDFFNVPNVSTKNSSGGKRIDENIYDPDPKAHNGQYKSVIRFIPYVFDKEKSKYTKHTARFYNPATKESLVVDCPSNIGKPSILWTIDSILRDIKKEEPQEHERLSKLFSRWYTNHSPVYIKKDPQRPDLEGKIFILKYRNQIDQLISQQEAPEAIDGIATAEPVKPFHLLEGKDFICVVGMKTRDFRDWSKCKFMDEKSPFIYKVNGETVRVEKTKESAEAAFAFMREHTPKMDQYLHQEWTEETPKKVAEAIVAAFPNRTLLERILARSKDVDMNELVRAKMGSGSKPAISVDEVSFSSESNSRAPMSEPTASSSALSENKPSDEYSDLFKDL